MILKSLLIVYLLASTIYASTHIRWRGGYHDALMEAKKNDKILMVLLIKNDCLECKNIVKNIFTNKPYIDELNKNIVRCKDVTFRILGLSLAAINTILSVVLSIIFLKLFFNYGSSSTSQYK